MRAAARRTPHTVQGPLTRGGDVRGARGRERGGGGRVVSETLLNAVVLAT